MKRILSGVLAFLLVLSLLPAVPLTAKADIILNESAGSWMLTLSVTDGQGTLVGCEYGSGSVVVPSVIKGYPVVAVGAFAFTNCTSLTSVTLPDSVTRIKDGGDGAYDSKGAFYGCSSLKKVTLGSGMQYIGKYAFRNCKMLTEITLPSSVTTISPSAFAGCTSLSAITIPGGVTSIGESAFSGCTGLTDVSIGYNVSSIAANAFSGCTGLTTINVSGSNRTYRSSGNCLIQTSKKQLVLGCKNSQIPNDGSVTSIGSYAFEGCTGLSEITIPDSVTSIGSYAFKGCTGLSEITIPDSVTSIGSYAFEGCTGLPEITIPDSVTSIGSYAFKGCTGLSEIAIPDSITSIGDGAFASCNNITSVYTTDIVRWCGIQFSSDTSNPLRTAVMLYLNGEPVTELVIPDGVTGIGAYAFAGYTGLVGVTIPDSVTTIGNYAFYNCSGLNSATMGSGVTTIGDYAFYGCAGVTEISIPDGVTTIGDYAFRGCTGVTEISIPDSVTTIGNYAFGGCTGLTEIGIPDSVTTIGNYAFYNCSGLTSATIGNSVTTIGDYAFRSCTGVTEISIPDSVTTIGYAAFDDCSGLTSATIGNSVTTIGDYAFRDCVGLTEISIPNSVTTIGNYAFSGCTRLTEISIPDSVTSIKTSAFEGCKIQKLIIAEGSSRITSTMVVCKSTLKNVVIPRSVTLIGGNAFNNCTALKTVTYLGYRNDRQQINIQYGNAPIENASWSYLLCSGEHTYSNACDTICDICSKTRSVGDHVYDHACDSDCNECGQIRDVPDHVYDDVCDTQCNICGAVRTVEHIYDNACDDKCNLCSFVRIVGDHTYTLNGGNTCSSCKYSKVPDAPKVSSFTADSLTLVSKDGLEYSIDGITWQDSPTFEGLLQNMHYTFYQRVKASENAMVSEPSPGFTVDFRVCTIRYDANGGQNPPDNQYVFCGGKIGLSQSIPTRNGYTFAGWATKESCGKLYASGEQLVVSGDVTLYALWGELCATCQGMGQITVTRSCTCDDGIVTSTTSKCSSCGWTDCISTVQQGNGISYNYCRKCGGFNTGSFSSTNSRHSACNGTGKLQSVETCTICAGSGAKENQMPAPIIVSYTDTVVTLRLVDGYEYSLDGVVWQKSNVFSGLSPATQYTFFCRVGATQDAPFGLSSNGISVKTDKSRQTEIPPAPEVLAVTSDRITLVTVDGCEYSKDGTTWQSSPVFTGLSVATTYTFYQRYATTSTTYAGASSTAMSAKTDKGTQSTPSAPTLSGKTHSTVTLKYVYGYQYSIDGVVWQDSNVFRGLNPATNYFFYCRKAETSSYYASEASRSLTVRTDDPPPYTAGDLNEDGAVDESDALNLLKHILLPEFYGVNQSVDYNGDGNVNEDDVLRLLKFILMPELFPLM